MSKNWQIVCMFLSMLRIASKLFGDSKNRKSKEDEAALKQKSRRREERDKFRNTLKLRFVDAKLKANPVGNNAIHPQNTDESANAWKIELMDIGSVPDIKVDSELIGHSGGLVVLNGDGGSGKSTLALQLMAEAALGQSSGLIPGTEGVTGPAYKAIYLHAERDYHFATNYGKYYGDTLGSNFKADCKLSPSMDHNGSLQEISRRVLAVNDNVALGIDNITAMTPGLKMDRKGVWEFIEGLKNIRKEVEAQGHHVVFFIVTHSNDQGKSMGSSDWFNLAETFINVTKEGDSEGPYRVIECTKRRGMKPFKVEAEIVNTDHVHFIKRNLGATPAMTMQPSTPITATPIPTPTSQGASPQQDASSDVPARKAIDAAAAALFYVEFNKRHSSLKMIFEKYKDEYELKDRYTARNKIDALPRLIEREFSFDQVANIWSIADQLEMTPEKALEDLGPRYGINDINIITYLIDYGDKVGDSIMTSKRSKSKSF